MTDQADKLRELVHGAPPPRCQPAPGVPMIVVAGSRNGVGSTTVAVNLGAALADRDHRVVIVDAAPEHADLAQAAGVGTDDTGTVTDVLEGRCRAADALVPGPAGTQLVVDRWASRSNRDTSRHAQQRLLSELQSLHAMADAIVVDAGSGLNLWSRRFWSRAKLVALVTTADDAAIMDAYAVIKQVSQEQVSGVVRVLANQIESDTLADDVTHRLAAACQRFLGHAMPALPALPRDDSCRTAGVGHWPRVWESPSSPFGHAVLWLGHAVDDACLPAAQDAVDAESGVNTRMLGKACSALQPTS